MASREPIAPGGAESCVGLPPGSPSVFPGLRLRWIIVLVLLSRLIVLCAFEWRGGHFPYLDGSLYAAAAAHVWSEGTAPDGHDQGGRLGVGVPLLVAAVHALAPFASFERIGLVLSLSALLAACAVFHRLTAWPLAALVFGLGFPGWVICTSGLASESLSTLLLLVGAWALSSRPPRATWVSALLLSGYSIVCRPTAIMTALPWLALAPMGADGRIGSNLVRRFWAGVLFATPMVLVLLWTMASTGEWFPSGRLQQDVFQAWADRHAAAGYPPRTFTWPGHSIWVGVFQERPVAWKPLALTIAHLGLALWAWSSFWRARVGSNQGTADSHRLVLSITFGVGLLFILSIGSWFGYSMFYRYLSTQLQPLLALGMAYRLRAHPWGVAAFCIASTALACLGSGQGG